MKKIVYSLLFIAFLASCGKENPKNTSNKIGKEEVKQALPTGKKKKKLRIKAGFSPINFNCGFSLPCGSCPGFCVTYGFNDEGDEEGSDWCSGTGYISSLPFSDQTETMHALVTNDSTLDILFKTSNIVDNNNVHVYEDFFIGASASSAFGYDSVWVANGYYPVSNSDCGGGLKRATLEIITK